MLKLTSVAVAAVLFASGAAIASESADSRSTPITLTAEQMDSVTAAAGYGKTIIDVAGAPFGQLIGPAKKAGTAAHSNYAGGAKALVETVCVHLPSAC